MDETSSDELALAFQLEEIKLFEESSKGKGRVGELSEFEIVTEVFKGCVKDRITFLKDRKMAMSIDSAISTDQDAILMLMAAEEQATRDRQEAIRLNPGFQESLDPPPYSESMNGTEVGATSLTFRRFLPCQEIAGPSRNDHNRVDLGIKSMASTCCTCLEPLDQAFPIKLKCGDNYHIDCMKELFLRATKDESLFPPRCHGEPIPLSMVADIMSPLELNEFKLAEEEFSTTQRLYCSNSQCAQFISAKNIVSDQGHCTECDTVTCTHCKGSAHESECPVDEELQATLALAEAEGWRRCGQCRSLVELDYGCFHMTCRCKFEFCYLCGLRWKTCSCSRWDEQNLERRAEVIVDREAAIPLPAPVRQRLVENMRHELLEQHDCEHRGRFQKIENGPRRGFHCEICSTKHWKYILQCRRCHLRVCEDCRRHRV